jgi:hypothetical protein
MTINNKSTYDPFVQHGRSSSAQNILWLTVRHLAGTINIAAGTVMAGCCDDNVVADESMISAVRSV